MPIDWLMALLGGALIGVSVSLMLYLNGRVTGISGIISRSFERVSGDFSWRISFLLGLIVGGVILSITYPQAFSGQLESATWTLILAGLLVGFGTNLGSGCTSGHGVCGISRFSVRSILATLTFIAAGILAVSAFRAMGVLV